jgi:ribulose-phosphate 3-epimerase
MQIIPALLPKNQTELGTKVKKLLGVVSHVQVDVCDGVFVSSKTLRQPADSKLSYLEEIEYELDLMIDKPERSIEDYIDMQPARIIVHLESVSDHVRLFLALERIRGIIEVGLSISNDTPNHVLEKYIEDCDFIQLMGISKIGSQGNSFDDRVLEKISYFHTQYPEMTISVDGSVNSETIRRLADAGATRFVAGSAIFNDGDIVENIEKLESLVN